MIASTSDLANDEAEEGPVIPAPTPETFNGSLKVSEPEASSEAGFPLKMKYEEKDKGRQRKYYEIIALLEMHHAGDDRIWRKLDEQMQRYFRREYPEYFDRETRDKRQKRQNNKVKAARIRHERFQREARSTAKVPSVGTAPLDLQAWRENVSG